MALRRESASGSAGGSLLRAFSRRLRRAGGAEDGMAIAAVVTLIGVGLAVSSAAVVAANTAIGGTTRDERSKDALAAADAAAQLALFRQNQVNTNVSNPCVVEGTGGDLFAGGAAADGWCAEVTGQAGDASWSYRTSPALVTEGPPSPVGIKRFSIVATGNADGITRRIKVDAETPIADAVFGTNTVIGKDGITEHGNAIVNGNAATNGDISLENQSQLCGNAQVGPGHSVVPGPHCDTGTTPITEGTVNLPPVDPSLLEFATDTSRFFTEDTISGKKANVTWDPERRWLTVGTQTVLTLGGENYNLCGLTIESNSAVFVADTANVRLYFDAPENCQDFPTDGYYMRMASNAEIRPTSGEMESLALIFMGSEEIPTYAQISSNNQPMPALIYAPNTHVDFNSNVNFTGAVAAQSLNVNSNTTINAHAPSTDFQLPVLLHYRQTRYVECSTASQVSSPDDYC